MLLIMVYSSLLMFGFVFAQTLIDPEMNSIRETIHELASFCLAYIMIGVGIEFNLPKKNTKRDHILAILGSVLPWAFCSLFFFFAFPRSEKMWWKSCILLGCFAAPTSAGILFSMLEAGGLSKTWVFKKAKLLAILDDLYTLVLLIPIRLLNFGFSPLFFLTASIILSLFALVWKASNRLHFPHSNPFKVCYAILITCICHILFKNGVELDVLVPAFTLGALIKEKHDENNAKHEWIDNTAKSSFMLLVGASMPPMLHLLFHQGNFWKIIIYTLIVTQMANLGKLVSALFYSDEAPWSQRMGLAVSMLPRGEVGAGILILASKAGIKGAPAAVAVLSLTLNLLLTGFFTQIVCKLSKKEKNA
ncbi:cation:proton antiporter [Candidatus Similichlamydia epinepheli]|uniref:cation:proton antiporter domain-containing protein n=1 Tax=Candidatus Similichlamydia epinepheli TaxID=1903953 RepID=UPI000D353929|nr:cation:proton antiporter [Candidatus Similichlamydia epinepheli]